MRTLKTVRFGELEFAEEDIIRLPAGLVGMPDLTEWVLFDMDSNIPLKWLQSLDRAEFCIPVTIPDYFAEDYQVEVPEPIWEKLGTSNPQEYVVLIITSILEGGQKITGNLAAPLLIHIENRRGVQLALEDRSLSMQQEINYLKFGLAVETAEAENDSNVSALQGNGHEQVGNLDRLKLSP